MKQNLIKKSDLETLDRIDRDCIAMHVCPPPKTFINMKVHDVKGELELDLDMKSNSWVRNAYNFILGSFLGQPVVGSTYEAGTTKCKTTSGSLINIGVNTNIDISSAIGITATGIVVGTGTTIESLDSYALTSLIANGNSANQLSYTALTKGSATYDSGTKKWSIDISRIMNNNSGASITVNEIAMYGNYNGLGYCMTSRDKLDSGVVVPNGGQLTVTYTMEMTFPT